MVQSMQELPSIRNRQRQGGQTGLQITQDPQRVTVSRMKSSYGDELKKQMEEDQKRKRKSKERDQDEDHHFLEEAFNYQPFGRGGAGAPLRDQFGNMITSFKPNFRGDHQRTHFLNYTKNSKVGSRNRSRQSGRFNSTFNKNQGKSKQKSSRRP